MTRKMCPLSATLGGIEITVHEESRRRIRRAARAAAVIIGYTSGIASITLAVLAVLQSALAGWVIGCGLMGAAVIWRLHHAER